MVMWVACLLMCTPGTPSSPVRFALSAFCSATWERATLRAPHRCTSPLWQATPRCAAAWYNGLQLQQPLVQVHRAGQQSRTE